MTRTKNAVWHYTTSLGLTAATSITGLVATPLLLRWLGQETLGVVRVASDWRAQILLLELGLAPALQTMLARTSASGGIEKSRSVMRVGAWAYSAVTLAMLLAGLGLTVLVTRLMSIPPERAREVQIAWLVGLIPFVFTLATPVRLWLEVRQLGWQLNLLLLPQSLLTSGLSLYFAWRGDGLIGQFVAIALASAPLFLFLLWRAKPFLADGVSTTKPVAARGLGRELVTLNLSILAITACAKVSLQTDNIVVSSFWGAAAVVPLGITLRLITLAQAQVTSVGNATWAALAELHAQGETARFSERLVELTRLTTVLGVVTIGPIFAFNHAFVRLWVGEAYFGGDLIGAVGSLGAVLQANFALWMWCFSSTGRARSLVPMYFAVAVVNLGCSVALTAMLGPVGTLLGTLISFVLISIWKLPALLQSELGVPVLPLVRAFAVPLAVGIPCAAALRMLMSWWEPSSWPSLIIGLAGSGVAFLGLAWFILFSAHDRRQWGGRVRHFLYRAERV